MSTKAIQTVYVLTGESGDYSDYRLWVEAVFTSPEAAFAEFPGKEFHRVENIFILHNEPFWTLDSHSKDCDGPDCSAAYCITTYNLAPHPLDKWLDKPEEDQV